LYKSIRSFKDFDRDELLLWTGVQFGLWAGVHEKVECFYTMLNFLLDTFGLVRRIKVTEGDIAELDESVELAVNERDVAYKI
jgi:hypothetical protein